MRTIECPCGRRLGARNDEELAREEHKETNLTEEWAREMVTSHASDTEDASS